MQFIVLLLLVILAWNLVSGPDQVELGPGIMAANAPRQININTPDSFNFDDYVITPLAEFHLKAKILSREDYYLDREADLSRTDLALGWGRMSDEAILEKIDISQGNRWYHWWVDSFPIPRREIENNSANMHLIPADDEVADYIDDSRNGDIIELSGSLVKVEHSDGWYWKSSMTREDTGARACEVVYVEHFQIVTPE